MDAVGIHVFAGGFTLGVQKVFNVTKVLETHNFGLDTARQLTEVINCPAEAWPETSGAFCYGNPRCTGFSTITSGYSEDTHGPWAKQTCDIHELCNYAAGRFDVICWESVQQAHSTGRPLLNYLAKEIFAPRKYRIAHILLSAASCGNSQHRRRYFFIAYRDHLKFNVLAPELPSTRTTAYDALWPHVHRDATEIADPLEYTPDQYMRLTRIEKDTVPFLPNGWNMNGFASKMPKYSSDEVKYRWLTRESDMPFSLHCIQRLQWLRPFPTIHSSAGRWIHPWYHRPVTIRELAEAMGWGGELFPKGPLPVAQIAKGVVPAVGTWLAEQAKLCLDGYWGTDDYESTYNHRTGVWEGRDTTGELIKTFNLTHYLPGEVTRDDFSEYPDMVTTPRYNYNGSVFQDRGYDLDCPAGRLVELRPQRPGSARRMFT